MDQGNRTANNTKVKKRIGLILAGVLVVGALVSFFISAAVLAYERFVQPELFCARKLQGIEQRKQNISILFVGASGIMCAVRERYFKSKSFNLAIPAESYVVTYLKLQKLLPEMPKLKMVVLPVSYGNLSPRLMGWNIAYLTTITKKWKLDNPLVDRWGQTVFWPAMVDGVRGVSIYGRPHQMKGDIERAFKDHFTRVERLLKSIGIINSATLGSNKKFISLPLDSESRDAMGRKRVNSLLSMSQPIDPVGFEYFKKTIELCGHYNIKIVSVTTPLAEDFVKYAEKYISLEEIYQATILRPEIKPLITAHFNYVDLFFSKYNYFKDTTHLNAEGAKQFSQILAEEIDRLL